MHLLDTCGGWIALSKDGYVMKHNMLAESGVKVEGDVRVRGVLISKPVDNLQCTPERRGSVRWNDKFFEGCDGLTDWRPLQFCSRSCSIDTSTVPCGIGIKNSCEENCPGMTGTGLNMMHCIQRVVSTPCNIEVRDMCDNACGIIGQFGCSADTVTVGAAVIRSMPGVQSTAAFQLTVGKLATPHADEDIDKPKPDTNNTLFLSYKDFDDIEKDLLLVKPLKDEKGRTHGVEFKNAPTQDQATFKISMFSEFTGNMVHVGADRQGHPSHLFIDGAINKECPFLFSGMEVGSADPQFNGIYTKVCLETPTGHQTITYPDGSGVVITSGNREDVRYLPGLRGDNVFTYTGMNRNMSSVAGVPLKARFECASMDCGDGNGTYTGMCANFSAQDKEHDIYRVYYMGSSGAIHASEFVRNELSRAENELGMTGLKLVQLYMKMTAAEAGVPFIPDAELEALAIQQLMGPVTEAEKCFACCCLPEDSDPGTRSCPEARKYPTHCVGGAKDGMRCTEETAEEFCGAEAFCTYDPSITCFETDFGFVCRRAFDQPNYTTTVNFTNPNEYNRLNFPDATGTIITAGNLQDVTRLGVQKAPIRAKSTNTSTTTIAFEPMVNGALRQRVSTPQDNTLLMPSSADGVLLSTGNLQDVNIDHEGVTGLRVLSNVSIRGWLEFADTATSGFSAPHRAPSYLYVYPAGGQPLGNQRPGQIPFGVGNSTTVLEIEPVAIPQVVERIVARNVSRIEIRMVRNSSDPNDVNATLIPVEETVIDVVYDTVYVEDVQDVVHNKDKYITVPAANGTAVTTGNLEDVHADKGDITSMAVSGLSYLEGGLTMGTHVGNITMQGSLTSTITFRGFDGNFSTQTTLNFQVQDDSLQTFTMPAASGTVITTGNLKDFDVYVGNSMNVSGATAMDGKATIGSNFETPIKFSGYFYAPIVHKATAQPPENNRTYDVPPARTWHPRYQQACRNNIPMPYAKDPLLTFPNRAFFQNVPELGSAFGVQHAVETLSECLKACDKLSTKCGILSVSRHLRVYLVAVSGYPNSVQYVSALPRKPRMNSRQNIYAPDEECFPNMPYVARVTPNGTVTFPQFTEPFNFSVYKRLRTSWTRNTACQAAGTIDDQDQQRTGFLDAQWGAGKGVWQALSQLEMTKVKCGDNYCVDYDGSCPSLGGCLVLLRSHVTGAYLSGSPSSVCWDSGLNGSFAFNVTRCAHWSDEPTLWQMDQATCNLPICVDSIAPQRFVRSQVMRFTRAGICAELSRTELTSATLTCGNGSRITDFVTAHWGASVGVCGAYNTSSACNNKTLLESLVRAACVGKQGCMLRLNSSVLAITSIENSTAGTSPVTYTLPVASCGDSDRLLLHATCEGTVVLASPSSRRADGSSIRCVHIAGLCLGVCVCVSLCM